MATWTKKDWDKLKRLPLKNPVYQASTALSSRLDSPGDKSILTALHGLKRRQSAAGKKRKQKQSWNYG
jgi:hypothetical protein